MTSVVLRAVQKRGGSVVQQVSNIPVVFLDSVFKIQFTTVRHSVFGSSLDLCGVILEVMHLKREVKNQ